ncbi:MAG: hypothetical protein KF851_00645 [Pirellulaceae bacterium]|jgi:hypothetical protein|nr:hypothetical protein [Pirellulaceae bacterium]
MKFNRRLFGFLALASACANLGSELCAQDNQDEGVQVQSSNAIVVSAEKGPGGEMQVMSFSSSGDGPMSFSMPMGLMGAGPSDPFSLLSNPGVQGELDLVGSQLDRYLDLQKSYAKEIQEHVQKITQGNFSREESGKLREVIQSIEERKKAEIENLLLPMQRERLKQISLQQRMQNAGAVNALGDEEMRKELGLSDDDVKRLKEKAKDLNEKLKKKLKELQLEIRDELLDELTSEQRAKVKSMLGDRFDVETPQIDNSRLQRRGER